MTSTDTQWYSMPEAAMQTADVNRPPPLVAIGEAPGYLGNISRSKVYELVAGGRLTRVHIGSRALISGDSIAAFLAEVLNSGGAA